MFENTNRKSSYINDFTALKRVAILMDENNIMNQLHNLGIHGLERTKDLFSGIVKYVNLDPQFTEYHIFGGIPNFADDPERSRKRYRFFESLRYDGIQTHLGYCVKLPNGKFKEKEVDMLYGLTMVDLSHKVDLIVSLSADGDTRMPIRIAKQNGAQVYAVLSSQAPASTVREEADRVIHLENVLGKIPDHKIIYKPVPKVV
ncbi:NYN domain-containing protein [Bacillus sp. Marseille-P3661]|uniref:NYN domain-containing protein n=1 Tax=Bacillus sp. Marseille-P3661 TaxID=1936234 RepID=UPI000C82F059|nr:NYN domain-containing protein [Bacillus sp. Marseille-P3661]